ncbi:hypothetical protein [Kiloniella laminariae]|uniref:hypothetical protein n=1 Tax=Kiloniella laminariae TaxID=454162 RepID=UPI00037B6F12|nr:hypothetical protein [Kiloniella laminariae]
MFNISTNGNEKGIEIRSENLRREAFLEMIEERKNNNFSKYIRRSGYVLLLIFSLIMWQAALGFLLVIKVPSSLFIILMISIISGYTLLGIISFTSTRAVLSKDEYRLFQKTLNG